MAIIPSDREYLFEKCDCFTYGAPEESGFYELELPDAYRWIRSEATCFINKPAMEPSSRWVLMLTANGAGNTRLAVSVNGTPTGEINIPGYGHYYFDIEPKMLKVSDTVTVTLKVNGNMVERPGRRLAMTVYCIKLLDVKSEDISFEERGLFINQVRIFRPDVFGLSKVLDEMKFTPDSKILDIGAGEGWTTVLLAARTGARATAIDPNHYDDDRELRAGMKARFSRHLSVLRREPGFLRINTQSDIAAAIDSCSFLKMSAMEMDFHDNTFDFVFSLNAFEHIPDPAIALKEVERVLKPGGEAYIQFQPIYHSDGGSHLPACGILDTPWAHLLYDRDEIRRMVIEAGKVPNEIDNILDSLNGWSAKQYHELFGNTEMTVLSKNVIKGFTLKDADKFEGLHILKKQYSLEELTTIGMIVHLRKPDKRIAISHIITDPRMLYRKVSKAFQGSMLDRLLRKYMR